MSAAIRIGTSGFHYKHWLGTFYPERWPASRMLEYYCERFDTVELNNMFYRLPIESAVKYWRESTPDGFCFAVKGSRFLTHMKKLKDPEPGLKKFFSRIEELKGKTGPIVWQLPPFWDCDPERLEHFLKVLPKGRRYAFELRNQTWHNQEIYKLLRRHNAAFCIYELAGFHSGVEITADFTYVRLHGPGGAYRGSYGEQSLQTWTRRIREWKKELKAVYVYFDNDEAAYAVHNALALRDAVDGPGGPSHSKNRGPGRRGRASGARARALRKRASQYKAQSTRR